MSWTFSSLVALECSIIVLYLLSRLVGIVAELIQLLHPSLPVLMISIFSLIPSSCCHTFIMRNHSLLLSRLYNFQLQFLSGEIIDAFLHEESLIKLFYTNIEIFESLGKECCLALDVALATSDCEAIVKGFYSVVKAHAKQSPQSNKVLIERAVVDWALPNPLTCPKVMLPIGKM